MFYIYELVDPRCGSVFYVGKGKKNRRFAHEMQAKKGKAGAKCDRIREILESGSSPVANIVERFTDEAEAYRAESARIAEIGLDNLTNATPGGGGGFSIPPDPVAVARKTVDRFRAQIRASLELAKMGAKIMFGPYDLTECCVSLARSVREKAGAEYFDKRVWDEISCQLV